MDNGWLKVDARLTRAGIFKYGDRREFRPPEEVFKADALSSFSMVPITDDHPPAFLDATNTTKYSVGHLGESVKQDGNHVRAPMLVTDAATVAKMEAGKLAVSCGYTADMDETPGEWMGQAYDAVQRNIRGNHVAIVDVARAGPEARVRMDSAGGTMIGVEVEDTAPSAPISERATMKIKIGGVEFEVTDQVAQAIEKERADAAEVLLKSSAAAVQAKADADTAKAKVDMLTADLAKETQARKDAADPAKLNAVIAARVALVAEAAKHLDADALKALETKGDHDVKVAVLAKLAPETKIDGKSVEYVAGCYDHAVSKADKSGGDALAAARAAAVGGGRTDGAEPPDPEVRRAEMVKANRSAWQPKA